jgi:hypothetical protein
MFNTISWQGYWTFLALSLTGYYLAVYLLYFRNDFRLSFHTKTTDGIGSAGMFSSDDSYNSSEKEAEDRLAESCLDEINAFFEQTRRTKCVKEELIYSLQLVLKKYHWLKASVYKETVSNVIVSQAEHHCSIHLSAEEVSHVWLD